MKTLNKAILIGYVGQDPEIKKLRTGKEVATFSLATNRSVLDKETNEYKSETDWHKIVVFNEMVISILKNLVKKGSKVYVEGSIEKRSFSDPQYSSRKLYTTDIYVKNFNDQLILLDSKISNNENKEESKDSKEQISEFICDEIPF